MIDLQRTVAARFPQWFERHRARVSRPLLNAFARFSRVPRINEFLARNTHLRGLAFVEAALDLLDARYLIDHVERERIPEHGRCVIVANHPLGAIDALALLKCVGDVRRDVKILANDLLVSLPGLGELLVPLRILGGKPSAESVQAAHAALANAASMCALAPQSRQRNCRLACRRHRRASICCATRYRRWREVSMSCRRVRRRSCMRRVCATRWRTCARSTNSASRPTANASSPDGWTAIVR